MTPPFCAETVLFTTSGPRPLRFDAFILSPSVQLTWMCMREQLGSAKQKTQAEKGDDKFGVVCCLKKVGNK
jgi:hypothetical protein